MLSKLHAFLFLIASILLLSACSQANESSEKETQSSPNLTVPKLEPLSELSSEQDAALDALNTLQVSTDEMNRLYSTFAGITQPCYPPDTSFKISQADLLIAMKQFVKSNCKNLSLGEQDKLAAAAVLAQEEYTVSLCLEGSSDVNFEQGAPMKGSWVMPNVLGRRDVIIVW